MSTKTEPLENTSVSRWLAELHMECYKKNLENFDTVQSILDIKDLELKKLGVSNSRDRATMLGSLASYRTVREDSSPIPTQTPTDTPSKSLLRKGSLRKLNLKGLLGSSGSKKNKKSRDGSIMSTSGVHVSIALDTTDDSSQEDKMAPIPDYEELLHTEQKPFQSSGQKAIPNEYVPTPPEMEPFRGRVYTIGVCQPSATEVPLRRPQEHFPQRDSATTMSEEDAHSTSSKSHHLSVVSMESGLSFGYDVEINPSLPLEAQPWFHGKLPRDEAEGLLHDDGDFLVRENTALPNTFTLSMRWRGRIDHTLIQCDEVVNSRNGTTVKYSFDSGAFDTIPELIFNHLKYQIPISKDAQNMLTTPINRSGAKVPFAPANYYQPALDRVCDDHRQLSKRNSSPDTVRQNSLRPLRSMSVSSSRSTSPRLSPLRDYGMRASNSSSDLRDSRDVERTNVERNAMSPPPSTGPVMRSRAMTDSRISRGHQKRDSFGDYEVMESVSLLGSPTSQRRGLSASPSAATPLSSSSSSMDVKYAEIRHLKKNPEYSRPISYAGGRTVASSSPSAGVKYAEIRFLKRQQQANSSPHPFSMYETVPSGPNRAVPYQSRADVLAQKLSEPTYATPRGAHQRLNRVESSPHPFARLPSHNLPRQVSSPLAMAGISEEGTTPPTSQPSPKMYAHPSSTHRQSQVHPEPFPSHPGEQYASKQSQGAAARVPKVLPGYDLLVKLHDILSNHSEEELAYHLTRADAVAFLLTPRPGEDKEVWKERVQQTSSSSGLYVGLQTLADADGVKLWKKLYFRHLSLTQTVVLSIVSAGDALERAKILRRFIDLAYVLQSGAYGNLFSFISIMQGLTTPQVVGMSQTWHLLSSNFPEAIHTHKELQSILVSLSQGVSMYATDQIAIPAIQHLKTAFHFEEPSLPGHAGSEDHSLLGEHSNLLVGLDGIHTIIAHASRFSYNARKKLEKLQYNVKLMDFFTQDFARSYLQAMGVNTDNHFERRRRFVILLDALVDRVESA